MGAVQVDLLLVSQLFHSGMLRALLASAALCWAMVPGQALCSLHRLASPMGSFPLPISHVAALTVPLIN